MLNLKKTESNILELLLAAANLQEVINNTRWQKYINTQWLTLGIDAVTQRKLAKQGFADLEPLDFEGKLIVFTALFKESNLFEIKNQCLLFLDLHKKKSLNQHHWPLLKTWVSSVDNWAHSDGLSSVYSSMLKDQLQIIYPQLKKWNLSENPWERRQSVVCLFYYSRTRTHFLTFEQSIALISNLLDDKEYYVQKGVGWALREAGNVYYDETLDFILTHINQIKPAAYSAAIEKLKPIHREQVKLLRKKKSTF